MSEDVTSNQTFELNSDETIIYAIKKSKDNKMVLEISQIMYKL